MHHSSNMYLHPVTNTLIINDRKWKKGVCDMNCAFWLAGWAVTHLSVCLCVGLPLTFARFSAVIFISIVSGDVLNSSVQLSTAGTVCLCQVTCEVIELQQSDWGERGWRHTHWTGAERQVSNSLLLVFLCMDPALLLSSSVMDGGIFTLL